jgi:hypothetical protein
MRTRGVRRRNVDELAHLPTGQAFIATPGAPDIADDNALDAASPR